MKKINSNSDEVKILGMCENFAGRKGLERVLKKLKQF